LSGIVAAVGAAEGMVAIHKYDSSAMNFAADYKSSAHVAVLARTWADLAHLTKRKGWEPLAANGVTPWTDDYSDLISSMIRKKF
jgi:hypothetical protein